MQMTRRTLLRGVPLLLVLPRASHAQEAVTWKPAPHPLNDSRICLGWWMATPFAGTVTWRDLLRQRPATLTNMAMLTSATSGLQRQTTRPGGWGHVACDGDNDVVVFPDLADNLPAMSVACWLRPGPSTLTPIVAKWQPSPQLGWILTCFSTGALDFFYANGAAHRGFRTTSTGFNGNQWIHVVATMSGTSMGAGTPGIAVNGRPHAGAILTQGTLTTISTTQPVTVGHALLDTLYWSGAVDDLRIYARALSADEARLLYQESRTGYPTLLQRGPALAYAPMPPVPTVKLPSLLFNH